MPYITDKTMRSGNKLFENGDLLQELCQKAAQNKDQNSKPHTLGKALRDDVQGFVEYRHQLHMDEINAEGLPAEKVSTLRSHCGSLSNGNALKNRKTAVAYSTQGRLT